MVVRWPLRDARRFAPYIKFNATQLKAKQARGCGGCQEVHRSGVVSPPPSKRLVLTAYKEPSVRNFHKPIIFSKGGIA